MPCSAAFVIFDLCQLYVHIKIVYCFYIDFLKILFIPGTSTVEFSGDNFLALDLAEERRLEVQELSLRFRTMNMAGLMLKMDSQVCSLCL